MLLSPERRAPLGWLARPFTALLLFGAVGMIAMVVVLSVMRGTAVRPAPPPLTRAASSAGNQAAVAEPPATPTPASPPALAPSGGTGGGDGGGD